jgi:hypothetical protein
VVELLIELTKNIARIAAMEKAQSGENLAGKQKTDLEKELSRI